MSISFLRKPWTKKKKKLSQPPADATLFNEFSKSYPTSSWHGSAHSTAPSFDSRDHVSSELDTEMRNSVFVARAKPNEFVWRVHKFHEGEKDTNGRPQAHPFGKQLLDAYEPSNIFRDHSSDHHPPPDIIHRSTFHKTFTSHPSISSVFSTPILSGPMPGLHDSHSQSPPDVFRSTSLKDIIPESGSKWDRFLEDAESAASFDQKNNGHGVRMPVKTCQPNITILSPSGGPLPVGANESISLEDEAGALLTSDFSLSLFPTPPTLPLIIRKHPLPKPLVLRQSPNKIYFPDSPASFMLDTTPLATPTTPKSPQLQVARNTSSPTSILKKPPGGTGRYSTINSSPQMTPNCYGFQPPEYSTSTSLSRGPGLRLASSSSNLRNEPSPSHRTTSSDSTSSSSLTHINVRQRALSRPEVLPRYSPLASEAYLNPRPAPKPTSRAAVEQVEWGYAV